MPLQSTYAYKEVKVKILLIILSILSSFFANLEKKTLQSDFAVTIEEGKGNVTQVSGSVTMQGTAFVFEMTGTKAAYDGKTMYIYSPETDELTLTEPDEEELVESNPLLFAKAVSEACEVTERKSDDGTKTIVTLVPEDPEYVGVAKCVLTIRTADLMPLQLEVKEGQKNTLLRLKNPKWVTIQPVFTIEPEETTFVNDLRL
jgi:outer membrane lipoprotein-sorting protein